MASTSTDERSCLVSPPPDTHEDSATDRQERYSPFDHENPDFVTLGARTHDVSSANGYIEDVSHLAEKLLAAARKVWPTRNRNRYKDVRVLLLHWDEDDLGVKEEVRDLEATFRELYRYHTESWQIGSEKPDRELKKKILRFVEDFESEDTLLIVYYAGHARPNSMPGESPDWVSRRKNATVVHPGGVQSILEECDSDVLLLYDCCHALHPSSNASKQSGGSITEVVAACGFEAIAAEVGGHSFTSNLTEVLAEALIRHSSQDRPFKVVDLHTQLISRLQSHKLSRQRDSTGKPLLDHNSKPVFEPLRRRTPIHYWLSSNDRSILLEPLELELELQPSADTSSQGDSETNISSAPSSSSFGDPNNASATTSNTSRETSPPSSAPSTTASYPMVIVSVRLASDEFEHAGWLEWLRAAPKEAVGLVDIQGIYGSFSTTVLLSMPVALWDTLEESAAITFMDFVTSGNRHQEILSRLPKLLDVAVTDSDRTRLGRRNWLPAVALGSLHGWSMLARRGIDLLRTGFFYYVSRSLPAVSTDKDARNGTEGNRASTTGKEGPSSTAAPYPELRAWMSWAGLAIGCAAYMLHSLADSTQEDGYALGVLLATVGSLWVVLFARNMLQLLRSIKSTLAEYRKGIASGNGFRDHVRELGVYTYLFSSALMLCSLTTAYFSMSFHLKGFSIDSYSMQDHLRVFSGLVPIDSRILETIPVLDLCLHFSDWIPNLLHNSKYAVGFALDGCGTDCNSFILPGGLEESRLYASVLNQSLYSHGMFERAEAIRIDHAPGTVLVFEPLEDAFFFDLKNDCVFGGDAIGDSIQICVQQLNASIAAGWAAFPGHPASRQECCQNGNWRSGFIPWSTKMTAYRQFTETMYGRRNGSILSTRPVLPRELVFTNATEYKAVFRHLLVPKASATKADIAAINSLAFKLARLHRFDYSFAPVSRDSLIVGLWNLLTVPQEFTTTAMQYANRTYAGRDPEPRFGLFPMPDDMMTTATIVNTAEIHTDFAHTMLSLALVYLFTLLLCLGTYLGRYMMFRYRVTRSKKSRLDVPKIDFSWMEEARVNRAGASTMLAEHRR